MLHTRLRGYPCGTKRGRSKLTSFLCAPRKRFGFSVGRKLLVFSVGIDIDLVFCVWGENDLISVWRLIDFFSCGWSKLTGFLCPGRKLLSFVSALKWFLCGWSELTWCQCGRSGFTWFQFRDRNWLGFCVAVGNDLVLVSGSKLFVSGHQNWFDFRLGIEIALISVLRSKWTWILGGGSKLTWF